MSNQAETKTSAAQDRDVSTPSQACSNPSCACGPDCNCGEGCVCTPAARCTDA